MQVGIDQIGLLRQTSTLIWSIWRTQESKIQISF